MGRNQYWAGRVYDLCVYYMTGTPEGSTESGFIEKPGIEPATPGLQGIALIHYTTGASLLLHIFVAVFLGCTSTGRVGLCFLWFYVQELPKAQPAVVLVLKRLRRRDNGLKSHPTDYMGGLFFTKSYYMCGWYIYSFAKLKKMGFTCH